MAIKIDIPGVGEVNVEGAAQESTMQEILKAINKSDKTKRREEVDKATTEKKEQELKKKTKKTTEELNSELEEMIKNAKENAKSIGTGNVALGILGASAKAAGSSLKDGIKAVGSTLASEFARLVTSYDDMAKTPIAAAAGMLKTQINLFTAVAKIGVDMVTAMGQGIVGIIPFIGDGVATFIGTLGNLSKAVIDTVSGILSTINDVLKTELTKRAEMFNTLNATFANFAGGMAEMTALAGQAGVGIANFSDAIAGARPFIQGMGVDAGTAARLLAKTMGAAGTAIGKGGNSVRNELFALGYSYKDQGKLFAQYMAQLKTSGVNLANVAPDSLARQTEEYAKRLKVLSDITGQDAQQLMQQARAEAQRGALMTQLNAEQSRAFQDAYATMAALPGQQGPKLQSALAQMLAGGVVTDPVIAGNQIVMDMLKKTASQISTGNINMVNATQSNLATAADAYRAAGDSATDFATLMNPGGTSAVAQGMSQFGNALREYRYDPNAADVAMKAADSQAATIDIYNALTATMTGFMVQLEAVTGTALPTYNQILLDSSKKTIDFVTAQVDAFTQFMQSQMAFTDAMRYLGKILGSIPGGQKVQSGAQSIVDAADLVSEIIPVANTVVKGVGIDVLANPGMAKGGIAVPPRSASLNFDEGGIASGSTSGYSATLHGTEAVVPLPDNRSIPVSLDSSSLSASVNQQTNVLNQILVSMNKNNNLTSGILQASM